MTELVGQLVDNITSLQCLLHAVLHLVPDGAKGNVQLLLTSRALDLAQTQGDAAFATHEAISRYHSDDPIPTPLSSLGDVSENGECNPNVNINKSALRSATTPSQPARQDDTDSDAPLAYQSSKRKRQYSLRPVADIAVSQKANTKANYNTPTTTIQPTPQSQVHRQGTGFQPMKIHERYNQAPKTMSPGSNLTGTNTVEDDLRLFGASINPERKQRLGIQDQATAKPQRTRRNEPFRISTALPENNPPKGPHCHCKAAASDPTLLSCAACSNKYHPRCVGKGRYAQGTYAGNPTAYMLKDLDLFGEDKPFKCGDCEAGFFGKR